MEMGMDIELFCPVPKPYVKMFGATANAGGRPLANLIDLIASQHHYLAVIELPHVQFCDSEVEWSVNAVNEVSIEGQITPAAIFANFPLGSKSKRIKLCPTETWGISFFLPTPVDWWTASVLFISKTEMEMTVMKSGSRALPATVPESLALWTEAEAETEAEAGPSGVGSPTESEVEEMVAGWLV